MIPVLLTLNPQLNFLHLFHSSTDLDMKITKLNTVICRSVVFRTCCFSCATISSCLDLSSSDLSHSHCKDKTEMKDCRTSTVPWRVFNERVGDFSLLFLLLSFCKLILKYLIKNLHQKRLFCIVANATLLCWFENTEI